MMKRTVMASLLAAILSLSIGGAFAAGQEQAGKPEQPQAGKQPQMKKREPVYGSHMMTRQERAEYRAKMRDAKTAGEREQIRKEHHERMKERAKERGITLPGEPPAQGSGMGPGGGGMGPGGMGPGGGMMGGERSR